MIGFIEVMVTLIMTELKWWKFRIVTDKQLFADLLDNLGVSEGSFKSGFV